MNTPTPKTLQGAYPHFTVSFLPYDPETKEGLLLYRGKNVRSVPCCYAIPSGLLEHGESFERSIIREMEEEIGIQYNELRDGPIEFAELYRNIPEDGYDWVIGIWTVAIESLRERAVNKEPHKHDFIYVDQLSSIGKVMENFASPDIAPNLAEPLFGVIKNLVLRLRGEARK